MMNIYRRCMEDRSAWWLRLTSFFLSAAQLDCHGVRRITWSLRHRCDVRPRFFIRGLVKPRRTRACAPPPQADGDDRSRTQPLTSLGHVPAISPRTRPRHPDSCAPYLSQSVKFWRIRGEAQPPAAYPQFRPHMAAVCKTVGSPDRRARSLLAATKKYGCAVS